jgi:hypothetical protein
VKVLGLEFAVIVGFGVWRFGMHYRETFGISTTDIPPEGTVLRANKRFSNSLQSVKIITIQGANESKISMS